MILTPIGQAFVRRASAVLTEVRRARDEAEQLHGGTSGKVVAGLSLAAHIALLPKALAPFRARYPHVELHLIEGWYPTLEAGLKDGSIDFYVGPRPDQAPSSELSQEILFENLRIILGRKNHPLAGARSLRNLGAAEWATASVTFRAEEELGQLFARRGTAAAAAGAAQPVGADIDGRARVGDLGHGADPVDRIFRDQPHAGADPGEGDTAGAAGRDGAARRVAADSGSRIPARFVAAPFAAVSEQDKGGAKSAPPLKTPWPRVQLVSLNLPRPA